MSALRIGIVGASGYSGAVAARLVAAHPDLTLAFVTSDKLAGSDARRSLGPLAADLEFSPNTMAQSLAADCDAIFLATPAEVSADLSARILATPNGPRIIDLSGAFRLATGADYPPHYGFVHPSAELLAGAWYGLPELFGPPPEAARLIANPGCYPTATLLALAPLVRAGLVESTGLIVDAKSGVTGAGVQTKQEFSYVEIADDVRAYKILEHQHTPEIARHLGRAAGLDAPRLTFTPHLVPLRRGLLATCYARPRPGTTAARVHECLADTYASAALIDVCLPGEVTMKGVAGTARARVGATANDDVVVAVGAIDNLLKGAAGQAIQNLNLLFGLGESAGLDRLLPIFP